MSTILKALRRLEEDKRSQAAMSLDAAVLDPARPARSQRLPVTSVAAGAMAALGVIAIAWSLSGVWLPGAVDETAAIAVAAAIEEGTPPAAVRVARREAAKPPSMPDRIEDIPRPPPGDPVPLTPSTAASRIEAFANPEEVRREMQRLAGGPVVRVEEPAPEPKKVSPDADPAAAPETVAVVEVAGAIETIEAVEAPKAARPAESAKTKKAPAVASPQPAVVAKASPPAPAPVSAPVSERVAEPKVAVVKRAPTPEVDVREIIWHPNPARRIVVFSIDGGEPRRLAEGDEVAGFSVAEIGLSDVELVHDGIALKRRIGTN